MRYIYIYIYIYKGGRIQNEVGKERLLRLLLRHEDEIIEESKDSYGQVGVEASLHQGSNFEDRRAYEKELPPLVSATW